MIQRHFLLSFRQVCSGAALHTDADGGTDRSFGLAADYGVRRGLFTLERQS
jgi:hypothetical protein